MVSAVYQVVLKMMQHNPSSLLSNIFQQSLFNFASIVSTFQIYYVDTYIYSASWNIDTLISDHMTFNCMLFTIIQDTPKLITICLHNGTLKLVDNIGNLMLKPNVILQYMYVSYFRHNLVSVDKLLDQNKLVSKFDQDNCFFQVLSTNIIYIVGKITAELSRFNLISTKTLSP